MAIPDLDPDGLLPPGVHDASLDEVRDRFGRFRETDRRVHLQRALDAYVDEARASGLVAAVIVDGSFTTGKVAPGDIDIIVVLRPDVDLGTELRPDQYNVVSAKRAGTRFPSTCVCPRGRPRRCNRSSTSSGRSAAGPVPSRVW